MTKRLLLKDGLRIGKTELGVMNAAALEYTAEALAALADSLPAVLTTRAPSGALGPELRVDVSGTSGGITVQTGTALYATGVTASLEATASLTVGVNTTNAKVVLTATASTAGLGLFALGSDRLTLTYTPATGKTTSAADLYKVNEYIRLSKGATNYGTFRITSVSAGDQVTTFGTLGLADLVSLAAGAVADVVHAPAGKFFEGYPLVGETTATVERYVGVVSVQSSSYVLTSSDVLLATASRGASGAATVIDARTPVIPRLAALQLTNSNIAASAAIDESKLSLTQALVNAKTWAHVQNTDTHTTSSTFRVAGVSGPRVLTEEDVPSLTANRTPPTAAMTGVSLEPATFSLNPGQTTTLVANPQGLASGSSVTYTFASSDTARATIVPNGASVTVSIPANATPGTVSITVSAVASAVQGYTGVTQTDATLGTIAAISGSGNALTSSTVEPRPVTMTLKNASGAFNAQLLTATVTRNPAAPTGTQISYAWASANSAVCVLDSGGSDDKKSLRAVAAGTTTVTMTASAVSGTTGAYTANVLATITIPVTITDSSTASLGEEINLRVAFNSGAEQAIVRWGAVCTTTGTYPNLSVQAGHELPGGQELTGAAFYDRDGRRYQITSHTAITTAGAAFTITVQKLDNTTPNALSGSNCYIQSMANTVQIEVLDSTGMQCYVTATAQATARAVGIGRGAAGATIGSNYRFVHTGANNTLTPTTRQTSTPIVRWGETSSGLGPVTLYDTWVGPVSTSLTNSAMAFAWNLDNMATAGYNRETMDVFARHKVGSGAYVNWVRTLDKNASGQNLSVGVYQVTGVPANTDVTAEFKLSDPAGLNLVPTLGGIPHPTTVVQRTLGNAGDGGVEVERNWSFAITGGSTWFDISGGFALGNAFATAATNVSSLGSNVTVEFNYPVEVTRIQLVLTTPLGPLTSSVKPILFPLDTFPPSLTGDFSNIVSGDLSASSTDRTINGVDINQGAKGIGCAIEYAGVQPTSGAGYVRAWFRART